MKSSLLLALLLPAVTFAQVSATNHDCAEDAGGIGSCTAGEINIASASTAFTEAAYCLENDEIVIESIKVNYGLNTGQRFDPLLWVGSQKNDPRVSGGKCFVSSAPPSNEIFQHLEGDADDSCLDISNPDLPSVTVDYPGVFAADCQDFDTDGMADVQAVVTWLQNTNLACGDMNGESLAPGAPPKCDYSVISVDIPFIPQNEQATLTLRKVVIGGADPDTAWTLHADTLFEETLVEFSGVEGDEDITAKKVPMGDFVLSESNGPGGYTASNWSCTAGSLNGGTLTLAGGDVAICTITNTFTTFESLTVAKTIVSDDGGSATLDDFNVSVDAVEVSWSDPSSTSFGSEVVSEQAGTYVLSEMDTDAYTEGTWSCLDDNEAFVPVTNGGLYSGASVTVAINQHVICSITNNDDFVPVPPVLTLLKVVTNDDGGDQQDTDWTLSASGPVNRSGIEGSPEVTSNEVVAGVYNLSESGPGGYTASSWGCSGGGSLNGSQLTLSDGDVAICTITNDDIAPSVTLSKSVDNTGGGTADANDFGISVAGAEVVSGATNFYLANSSLQINETGLANYVFVEITGDAKCPAALGDSVSLDEGENLSCTISNQYTPDPLPVLTLQKVVNNDNGGNQLDTDWTLSASGPVNRSGIEGSNAVTATEVLAGVYTLGESGPGGYTAGNWGCSGGGSLAGNQLTLANGDVTVCSITNDDIAPTLTLTKSVDNTGGGTAGVNDFGISVGGANVVSGAGNIYQSNIPLSIDEDDLPGYIFVSITGDARCPAALGESVSLDEGENLQCTITNQYTPDPVPKLTLLKTVTNDNGGNQIDTDWVLTASGPVVRSGVEGSPAITNSDVLAGVYTLSESGPSGYTVSDWGCSGGGSLIGNQLTLANGDVTTCSITNDDVAPTLTLTKSVDNTGGGTAGVNEFGISVAGNIVSSGVSNNYLANTPLAIDESGKADYIFISLTGDAKCPAVLGGSVSLDEGENLSCTITNQYTPDPLPKLTLLKVVNNDNGGDQVDTDWTLTATGPVNRSGIEGSPAVTASEVLAGVYTLSESGPDGYTAGNWGCTGGGSLNGNQLTLADGDVSICTIINDDIAPTLTLTKSVDNTGGGTAGVNDFGISVGGANVVSGAANIYQSNTPLSIDEDDLPGYIFVSITGDARCPAALGESVSLDEGENLQCTITNQYTPDPVPKLTLLKTVTNDNGGNQIDTDWVLTASGPVIRSGVEGSPAITNSDVLAGVYTLSENGPTGYTAGNWDCSGDGSLNGNQLTLANGDIAVCSITNNDIAPSLTLTKVVDNSDGGAAGVDDFGISVAGNVVVSGVSNQYSANSPLAINEAGLANYIFISLDGDAKCPAVLGGSVSLDEGENLSCTITNKYTVEPPPILTLLKEVINDNGGDQLDTDWTLSASGPVVRSGVEGSTPVTNNEIPAGVYSLSESGPDGYAAGSWSCNGGVLNGNQLTLVDTDVVTCSISNDDIAPTLILSKQVDNTDGGSATADDFGLSVGGNAVLSGASNDYQANTPLIITEAGATDYIFVSITGDTKCPSALGDAVSLDEGEQLNCIITNKYSVDPPPTLTLLIDVVNDNGGDQIDTDWILTATGPVIRSGIEGSPAVSAADVLSGVYLLSEDGPDGYQAGDWSCVGGGSLSGNQLTLADSDVATCTIVNDDIAPTLTLIKQVTNDNEGVAGADDFGISVAGNTVLSGESNEYPANSSLEINEEDVAGYIFVSISGDAKCPENLGESLSLDEGEHIQCVISNDDTGVKIDSDPTLTLIKQVINDDGGTATANDFSISVAGVNVQSGQSKKYTANTALVINEVNLAGYQFAGISGHPKCPANLGGSLSLDAGENITCTITNDDVFVPPPPPPPPPPPVVAPQDLSVTKTITSETYGCPLISGNKVQFAVTIENLGDGTANGVLLNDNWGTQLKPAKSPDMYDCSLQKERSALCKLGNIEAGGIRELSFDYLLGSDPTGSACNLARVSSSPNEIVDTDNNESEICFSFVEQLGTQPNAFPVANVGVPYSEKIVVTGGNQSYEIEVSGLPSGGLAVNPDSADNEIWITGCPTGVAGSSLPVTINIKYFGESGSQACDTFNREYSLVLETEKRCTFSGLIPVSVAQRGTSTGTGGKKAVGPDESIQKVVINDDRGSEEFGYRYLVGFSYADHNYASDPNGQFAHHDENYDIRLVKYDSAGGMIWDKTYDTGNDDYGYAVSLSADKSRIYVGGGSEVESSSQARHEAILLEIDAASGCNIGEHFQSSGSATTSAFYDITSDGTNLYAVGERQGNPEKSGEFGALVSVYKHGSAVAGQADCTDQIIVSDTDGDELIWQSNMIRDGANPTVAYTVELPDETCEDCNVLVGGKSAQHGWVDEVSSQSLVPLLAPQNISIQGMTVFGDRFVLVGSSSDNDMKIFAHDRSGDELWSHINLGKGRLRAVQNDPGGIIYAVGSSDGEGSAGLVFKFDADGNEIDRAQMDSNSGSAINTSFHDIAISGVERGVIAGQIEETLFNFGWLQADFNCEGNCESP